MTRSDRRLLHTSDLHVGCDARKRSSGDRGFESLEAVIELGRSLRVDLLLIVGDLFDNPRVRPEMVSAVGDRLAQSGLRTVILPGNHDIHSDGTLYSAHAHVFPDGVHILSDGGGETVLLSEIDIQVWGRAHVSYYDHSPLDPGPNWVDPGAIGRPLWRIVLAHGLYYSGVADRHRSYLIHDEHLDAAGADYIALGHVDTHGQVGPPDARAYYPGAPAHTQGATLVSLSDAGTQVRHVKFTDGAEPTRRE